ncbi:MAG: hypothetical protein P8N56_01795 [Schleiferiaceae bacterium]|nr:hypothetical protein [Schleiferiaceae bacterium]
MEQSGAAPGWQAIGVQWMHPKGSVHGIWGPKSTPSLIVLTPISLSQYTKAHIGWGLDLGAPCIVGAVHHLSTSSREAAWRMYFNSRQHWESHAWVKQKTEWGWDVMLSARMGNLQNLAFFLGASPAAHPHLKGIYVSSNGQWRVHWESRFGRIFFGSGPYPYVFLGLLRHSPPM